jgi:hypothetical protein
MKFIIANHYSSFNISNLALGICIEKQFKLQIIKKQESNYIFRNCYKPPIEKPMVYRHDRIQHFACHIGKQTH